MTIHDMRSVDNNLYQYSGPVGSEDFHKRTLPSWLYPHPKFVSLYEELCNLVSEIPIDPDSLSIVAEARRFELILDQNNGRYIIYSFDVPRLDPIGGTIMVSIGMEWIKSFVPSNLNFNSNPINSLAYIDQGKYFIKTYGDLSGSHRSVMAVTSPSLLFRHLEHILQRPMRFL